ncbi:hypothetical protein AAY473_008301 [Plecturocebus cupreus]
MRRRMAGTAKIGSGRGAVPGVETGFYHVGQAGLELLTSGNPPTLAFQSNGITGVRHCAWPMELFNHIPHGLSLHLWLAVVDFLLEKEALLSTRVDPAAKAQDAPTLARIREPWQQETSTGPAIHVHVTMCP